MERNKNERPPVHNGIEKTIRSIRERAKREGDLDASTARKIMNAVGKGMTRLMLAGTLLTLAVTANHARTRYEVTTEGTGADISFAHEDRDTTEILNFLTGKAPFPERFRLMVERQLVRYAASVWEVPAPENLDSMSHEELRDALRAVRVEGGMEDHMSDEDLERSLTIDTTQLMFDPDIYRAIWEAHRDNGSPRLRFASPSMDLTAESMGYLAGPGRAFYDPVTNTIYLNPASFREAYVDELAHAQQFDEEPLTSNARGSIALLRTFVDSVRHLEDLHTAYQRQYGYEGSLEHDAHKEREQAIRQDITERYRANRRARGLRDIAEGANDE